jgi:hypothetical protein
MPKSWPWNAPEHLFKCKPAQGRKMDVFSFGMLCLWVVFEKYLSAIVALPPEAHWAEQYLQKDEEHLSIKFLSELKRENKLSLLTEQLVFLELGLPGESKDALQQFFRISLPSNPENRAAGLKQCFGFFATRP